MSAAQNLSSTYPGVASSSSIEGTAARLGTFSVRTHFSALTHSCADTTALFCFSAGLYEETVLLAARFSYIQDAELLAAHNAHVATWHPARDAALCLNASTNEPTPRDDDPLAFNPLELQCHLYTLEIRVMCSATAACARSGVLPGGKLCTLMCVGAK